MKKHKRYGNRPMRAMSDAAIGLTGVALTTGVAAGISSMAPAGTPSMMGGFSAIGSMAPIAVTGSIGMSMLPKKKKSKGVYF